MVPKGAVVHTAQELQLEVGGWGGGVGSAARSFVTDGRSRTGFKALNPAYQNPDHSAEAGRKLRAATRDDRG